jgi:hypothetical protein
VPCRNERRRASDTTRVVCTAIVVRHDERDLRRGDDTRRGATTRVECLSVVSPWRVARRRREGCGRGVRGVYEVAYEGGDHDTTTTRRGVCRCVAYDEGATRLRGWRTRRHGVCEWRTRGVYASGVLRRSRLCDDTPLPWRVRGERRHTTRRGDEARGDARHERRGATHDDEARRSRATTRHAHGTRLTRHDDETRRRGTTLTTSVVRRSRHEATHDAHDDARHDDERDATRVRHDERGATLRRAWYDARCDATRRRGD